jgi:hypothetical protein
MWNSESAPIILLALTPAACFIIYMLVCIVSE